ncbi:hypothetical protein [Neisseria sp. 83E34]|uniref:hypothetical protein n=1 Tax=Neisseria sp. 83E34 TaxID=1692264 RepID=UPI0006CE6945|nr:hypothetical protein [Neisseria sp. 83E34]KPN71278.1 hypothetical protein AKG09_07370 [Neisseria sp. 83E34]
MQNLNYPLNFLFKIFTPSNDFTVTDNNGQEVAYTRQKIFRIKEAVEVYENSRREKVRYTLKADRIIDFNAVYSLRDEQTGTLVGKLKREGVRSLWRTSYLFLDADGNTVFTVKEENPWIAVADGVLSEIPIIGMLSGLLLNPTYNVTDTQGKKVFVLQKTASFMERKFSLQKTGDATPEQETLVVLGLMMLMLQSRGNG